MAYDKEQYRKAINACDGKWEEVKDKTTEILKDCAQRGARSEIVDSKAQCPGLITYGALVKKIKPITFDRTDDGYERRFYCLLAAISEDSYNQDGFILTALVVRKDTRRPGGQFYRFAKNRRPKGLGLKFEDDEQFWNEQREGVLNHYAE